MRAPPSSSLVPGLGGCTSLVPGLGGSTSLVPGLGGMQLHSPGTRGVPGLAVHNIQKYPSPRTAGYLYHIVPGLWVVPGLAATDQHTILTQYYILWYTIHSVHMVRNARAR